MEEDIQITLRQHIEEAYQNAFDEDPQKGRGWQRKCDKFSDVDFILRIILRALLPVFSGEAFVQHCQQNLNDEISRSNFFLANTSPRRVRMLDSVMPLILRNLRRLLLKLKINHIGEIDYLERYDCVAFDGHCIKPACHTKLAEGLKNKVNSCFIMGMDYRTGLVMPLKVLSTGFKKRHEAPCLVEACEANEMRWGLRYNQISVYDRAVSSLDFLVKEHRKSHYLLTREKKTVTWDKTVSINWDRQDPINRNVISDSYCYKLIDDELCRFRIVEYSDPIKRKVYRYLSCLPDKMPPGVIAELYRRRWQIEKTYDNSKNSLFEQKAWGTSQETHKVQMYAIVSAMNFIRYFQEINLWDLEHQLDSSNDLDKIKKSTKKISHEEKDEIKSTTITSSLIPKRIHLSQIKREKRFQKEIDYVKNLGGSLSPLRYVGNLMRLTEFCVRTVQNAILSSRTVSWLRIQLKLQSRPRWAGD